jgi:hypothetical protein
MAYNPNINQNIRFEIKPMLYKKATVKKDGYWITNFVEGSTDYATFEAWKCVYFPLNMSNEDFCKEWRTITDKTFYKLSKLKNEALGIESEVRELYVGDDVIEGPLGHPEVKETENIEAEDNDTGDSSVSEQEPEIIETEQTEE